MKVKRVLISVSDKTDIINFAKELHNLGIEIFSTGGSAKVIKELEIPVKDVSDYTGFPEMLDGRVKTLHPKIHGGILAIRNSQKHMEEVSNYNIDLIDLVVVNLYPFEQTIKKENVSLDEVIENIDIGGTTLIRAASKNYKDVAVVVNHQKYKEILNELKKNNCEISLETCQKLAVEAFMYTAKYDAVIYNYLYPVFNKDSLFPPFFIYPYEKVKDLRYGENPHQKAAFYKDWNASENSLSKMKKLSIAQETSFNNILDINATLEILKSFSQDICAVIIKHNNPCGVGISDNLCEAYKKAYNCDSMSAFGGIVGLNRKVDLLTAIEISKTFIQVVVAPDYEKEAFDFLNNKGNMLLFALGKIEQEKKDLDIRKINGGILIQEKSLSSIPLLELKTVTSREPNEQEKKALLFAWKVIRSVKSNAIVLSLEDEIIGIGAGQMSRIDSMEIAIKKAGDKIKGSVLASDAFFPKPDIVEMAAKVGITAIIQPGGSKKDNLSIELCNQHNIAMVFTGTRQFLH
ncbi:MAG: bifunctional phosphoribosylaminoimidazolecarboxamide formyltransferase/IMP cyclohydrolase [bacterium]